MTGYTQMFSTESQETFDEFHWIDFFARAEKIHLERDWGLLLWWIGNITGRVTVNWSCIHYIMYHNSKKECEYMQWIVREKMVAIVGCRAIGLIYLNLCQAYGTLVAWDIHAASHDNPIQSAWNPGWGDGRFSDNTDFRTVQGGSKKASHYSVWLCILDSEERTLFEYVGWKRTLLERQKLGYKWIHAYVTPISPTERSLPQSMIRVRSIVASTSSLHCRLLHAVLHSCRPAVSNWTTLAWYMKWCREFLSSSFISGLSFTLYAWMQEHVTQIRYGKGYLALRCSRC